MTSPCCRFKRMLFYTGIFLPLIIIPLTIGTIADCLALVTSGAFALTILPILVDRHLHLYCSAFTSSSSYTFGYARAGILFQFMCYVGSSTVCVTLNYLAVLRFFHAHPRTFNPLMLVVCCGGLLGTSFIVAIIISSLERHSKSKVKGHSIDNLSETSTMINSSSEEMDSVHSGYGNLSLGKRRGGPVYATRETMLTSSSNGSQREPLGTAWMERTDNVVEFSFQQYFLLWCYVVNTVMLLGIVVLINYNPAWEKLDAIYPLTMSIFFIIINATEGYYILSILVEATPPDIDIKELTEKLRFTYPSIKAVHNTRIWRLTPYHINFVAHLLVESVCNKHELLCKVHSYLKALYRFENITLQIEDELFC